MTAEKKQELAVIKQVLGGDHDAYRALVDRYHKGLINHLYSLVGERETAEDLAQEAFLQAFQKLDSYNSKYAFSTWLYKIATNRAYSHLRKRKTLPLFDADRQISDEDVSEKVERRERQRQVFASVQRLPNHYRAVVSLYYWRGLSYEEMAVAVDAPVGTVKTWLHRAKSELREDLYEIEETR